MSLKSKRIRLSSYKNELVEIVSNISTVSEQANLDKQNISKMIGV